MNATDDRGYSLLIVMLVLVVLAAIGVTAMTTATLDEGAAAARAKRAQAVVAAETGLAAYSGIAAPSLDCAAALGTQLLAGSLPPLETNHQAGDDVKPRFTVSVASQPAGIDGCNVQVLGEVLDGGDHVVGRAQLNATVQNQRTHWGYGGQKDYNPQATGSDTTGRLGYFPNL